ncbi:MAG TPA: FAD-binding protein [Ignavibacteria bacterium]|nr:FAD-binding protein [Ignavibacteria bacterium]
MTPKFQKDVLLSDHTTIGLGGKAKKFISCDSAESIINVLQYAKDKKINVKVISAGSNIVFPDKGFDGIVLKVDIKGIENILPDPEANKKVKKGHVKVKAGAGENWDNFVKHCIKNDLAGVECLSGIPGSVGATPVQNVGAYGQEVKNIIYSLTALDRETFEIRNFFNKECEFEYRQSRFKKADKDKYIILDVVFYLIKFNKPKIKYLELQKYLRKNAEFDKLKNGKEKLKLSVKQCWLLEKRNQW